MRQAPEGALLAEVIAIVGPTGSGKTELALALAREIGGEIVSADSRQVYRGLDAGTAKPARDRDGLASGVPYHLLDVADPSEAFDAGRFAESAGRLCAEIRARGKIPIVAGGTGLYLRALLEGLSPLPARDPAVRERLQKQADRNGRSWLHGRLASVDPPAAAAIPANNLQRTMRALEVYELTGRPISALWAAGRTKKAGRSIVLAVAWPPEALKARLAARAEQMWPGILAEVGALLRSGRTGDEPGFQSLGYAEAVACLREGLPEEEGLKRFLHSTLAYAKRQRTWFRRQVEGSRAIAGGPVDAMLAQALQALA